MLGFPLGVDALAVIWYSDPNETRTTDRTMYCNICGTEKSVSFYIKKACQNLCDYCAKDTPNKVSKESFCKAFFNTTPDNVNRSMLNEFYSDYRASVCTLKDYVDACTMRE